MYVGKGKRGRWKHGNSGCSHVFGLNEILFKGDKSKLQCKFEVENVTNSVALSIEKKLISSYKTPLNFDNNEEGRLKKIESIKQGLLNSGYKPTGKKANTAKHKRIIELDSQKIMTKEEIADAVNVGVATVYRVLSKNFDS